MARVNKVDSNITGLRYADEVSLGVLPAAAAQIWKPFEPNSYKDFGGQITTIARRPINASRQRKKGVVTGVEASGGFNTDLTQTNLQDCLQGFFFADLRKKAEYAGVITSISTADDSYNAAAGLAIFRANDLVFITGCTNAANNGIKTVVTAIATKITVAENLVTETPPVTGTKIVAVGFQYAVGDANVDVTGSLPKLASTAKDATQFGLIPGEFIFIGGDTAGTTFANAVNSGFCRVKSVVATGVTFDKTANTMVLDTGAGKTVRVFFGRVLKNESGTLIKRRSYQLERQLGYNNDTDITKQQAEYLVGSIPGEFTLNTPTAEKVTCDLTFVSLRNNTIDENVTGANTLLSKAAVVAGSAANAPNIVESDAFNTSTDVSRIKLATFTAGTPNPTPLFAFVQELTLTINNNLTGNKAIGVTGNFEVTAGTFEVGGKITAYFADVAAVQAVQNNADITLDAHFVKANSGISFDLPLIALGDGRPTVEQDQAVTLPLENNAAAGGKIDPNMDHTCLMVFWDYLPNLADV